MHRLESVHPAVREKLGRPSFTLSAGIAPRLALVRFVCSQHFRALGDAALT